MKQLVTTEEMQALDQYTMTEVGMGEDVLIERAALAALESLGAGNFDLSNVLVLVGLGNNGADGIALARLLHQLNITVALQFVGNVSKAKPAVKRQLKIAEACGVVRSEKSDFKQASLIIDAIFGTGLNNDLPDGLQKMVKAANHIESTVVALDIPTGINGTTGQVMGAALKAKTTIAFGYEKAGLTKGAGKKTAGQVVVKDIGILAPKDFKFSIKAK
ncbi:NAD(P)H-hydrate epimerase [Fructobacillus pseudoficulneus]|uniref:NAD(P)H-hydrate epimerase n=1 Tax=Fructobacillus pseudoficulneus TaxID=220714 RepID=A0A3F3GVN8_9LACO|nr:NAD(P)H-hydrate epimerase [Fructobacillus pseudoficulneus]GAP03365.1 NAD(P)H-hydrate epimerase [Fructobacillus pseudoficulneus]SEH43744.1 yjeF N-terminal region [Fructobacillus pseudoficulneus]